MGSGSLDIMEVDPQESMKGELKQWADVSQELMDEGGDNNSNNDKNQEWSSKIHQFQEWLSGIPGIDEATALSTAITHIESGKYDLIVFDTAPTGHTLKLLALPEILEQGIDKLQSWQSTFWGYWEAFKAVKTSGLKKAQRKAQLKDHVTDKLTKYKHDIQKVACMLQDQTRTRFVVVCIAEFLSVSETQRLLQELSKNKVIASHIVVNQLVVEDALESKELAELESLAEVGNLQLPQALLQKTIHACRLTTARKIIQQRYLSDLQGFPETQSILEGICQVPLLAEEVTGTEAIQRFAKLLIKDPDLSAVSVNASMGGTSIHKNNKLYDDVIAQKNKASTEAKDDNSATFSPGDTVQVQGLAKSPHFNDLEGMVTTHQNVETGRYGVKIQYEGKSKTLALQPKNLVLVSKCHKKSKPSTKEDMAPTAASGIVDKAKKILEDPEIKDLVAKNPRFKAAVEECLANPMAVMQYLGDPEMSPLISKVMAKL